ncbi:ComEC/Rec2 family competence protein [Deferribacter abyssi]|uniref:ComEC/Rec2 family competence protein n=1 Tax=Deferribacter abyssi TaxID=213806 RepID=UPI003C16DD6D
MDIITEKQKRYSKGITSIYKNSQLKPGTAIFKLNNKLLRFKIPIVTTLLEIREKLCKKIYIESCGEVSIIQAALFGNRIYLDNTIKDLFIITGIFHLLAISGLHVGIIISISFLIFSFLPLRFRYLAVSLTLIPFTILTGLKITVLRASLFAIFIFVALFFDIKVELRKLLLFIASLFLFLFPSSAFDISFQLSFAAVFGILTVIEKEKGLKSAILVPLGATLFTMPIILYSFGNFNYLGILNTFIMLPFIYLLIITGLITPFTGHFAIAPLITVESWIHKIATFLYKLTYSTFILNKINFYLLIFSLILILLFIILKKFTFLLLLLIIPLINFEKSNIIIFPNMIRSKGIIDLSGRKQVFFKGFYNDFKYKFLPIVAKFGIKKFDNGIIHIYDGQNLYFKIKNNFLLDICINKIDKNCKIVYMTKSNSISKKLLMSQNKIFIIYKNEVKSKNIYELKNKKCIILKKGEIIYDNGICK